jgi:CcmD family protein
MMGAWKFVFLAYGIVWSVLLLYLVSLWRRCRKVEADLTALNTSGEKKTDG